MKRILVYNWSRLDDPKSSGGVGFYTKRLVSSLIQNPNYEIFFLNSGYSYTLDGELKIKAIPNSFGRKVKSFEIVNSPILAPSPGQSVENIKQYLEDESLYFLLKDWFTSLNGLNIIHFQNLEGLSLKVLTLKKDFPNTKFIYSLHNYFAICPAVNLWNRGQNCNKKSFDDCTNCFRRRCYTTTKIARIFNNSIIAEGVNYHLFQNKAQDSDSSLYQKFFIENKQVINFQIDSLLAVSNRVKDIFVSQGYDEKKIKVSYIGTKCADQQQHSSNANISTNPFKIIYMGYMNDFKGFYFLMNALDHISEEISKNIHLTICAKYTKFKNSKELKKIDALKSKFFKIDLVNGYDESNQQQYLQNQHLGIVPVLWEDNLPQVLIEQIAYGVPVLCSDLGGGKEIVNNSDFVFKAANTNDFINKLLNIYTNRSLLDSFWKTAKKLTTFKEHMAELENIYEDDVIE